MTVLLGHAINVLLGECDIEWYIIRLALHRLKMFVENNFIVSTKSYKNELTTDYIFLGNTLYLFHFSPELLYSPLNSL